MEEAEALADRVLVLSGGAVRCCSTLQDLRAKQLGSCTLTLHVKEPPTQEFGASASVAASTGSAAAGAKALAAKLLAALPSASVLVQEAGLLLLHIPVNVASTAAQQQQQRRPSRRQQQQHMLQSMSVAGVLGVLESRRQSAGILRYSLSYGSLETELVQLCGVHTYAVPAELDADA
jgi:ABC-type multidrug transport system ATPase subunit